MGSLSKTLHVKNLFSKAHIIQIVTLSGITGRESLKNSKTNNPLWAYCYKFVNANYGLIKIFYQVTKNREKKPSSVTLWRGAWLVVDGL